jgi:hypothetical protein
MDKPDNERQFCMIKCQICIKLNPTALPAHSKYETQVRVIIRGAKQKLAVDNKDINTILRVLQEEADKWIETHP